MTPGYMLKWYEASILYDVTSPVYHPFFLRSFARISIIKRVRKGYTVQISRLFLVSHLPHIEIFNVHLIMQQIHVLFVHLVQDMLLI